MNTQGRRIGKQRSQQARRLLYLRRSGRHADADREEAEHAKRGIRSQQKKGALHG